LLISAPSIPLKMVLESTWVWLLCCSNNVKAGTPAAQIGLKKGDVIVGANQQPVKNIADLTPLS
jgi:C-terminal processing protease CtpA/Prc